MTDRPRVKMPFGKYSGTYLSELSPDYVRWLHTNPPFTLRRWLADAISEEYQARGMTETEPPEDVTVRFTFREIQTVADVFEAGFRALIKATHPDVGGSLTKTQELNAIRDSLASQLKQQRQGGAR